MSGFAVDTVQLEVETRGPAQIKRDHATSKDYPGVTLTGRYLSLEWSDFVVRQAGGQRPIFAMSKVTIAYLEGTASGSPLVQVEFSCEPGGEFTPSTGLSLRILTEDSAKVVFDEWDLPVLSNGQFCYPPKPPVTPSHQIGPKDDIDYFGKISLARLVVPSMHWISCPGVH